MRDMAIAKRRGSSSDTRIVLISKEQGKWGCQSAGGEVGASPEACFCGGDARGCPSGSHLARGPAKETSMHGGRGRRRRGDGWAGAMMFLLLAAMNGAGESMSSQGSAGRLVAIAKHRPWLVCDGGRGPPPSLPSAQRTAEEGGRGRGRGEEEEQGDEGDGTAARGLGRLWGWKGAGKDALEGRAALTDGVGQVQRSWGQGGEGGRRREGWEGGLAMRMRGGESFPVPAPPQEAACLFYQPGQRISHPKPLPHAPPPPPPSFPYASRQQWPPPLPAQQQRLENRAVQQRFGTIRVVVPVSVSAGQSIEVTPNPPSHPPTTPSPTGHDGDGTPHHIAGHDPGQGTHARNRPPQHVAGAAA